VDDKLFAVYPYTSEPSRRWWWVDIFLNEPQKKVLAMESYQSAN
jgi:hypothetical protein